MDKAMKYKKLLLD